MKSDNVMRNFFILMGFLALCVVFAGVYMSPSQMEEIPIAQTEIMVELQQISERLDDLNRAVETILEKSNNE